MKLKAVYFLAFIWPAFMAGCASHQTETKVVIYTRAPLKSFMSVTQLGELDSPSRIADTVTVRDNHDSLVFYFPRNQQHLYMIGLRGTFPMKIYFVNDTKLIRIKADYFADTCSIAGSPASSSLKAINDRQLAAGNELDRLRIKIDSFRGLKNSGKTVDSLIRVYNATSAANAQVYKQYADTVKNAAVFMSMFSSLEFGKDYAGLRKFITHSTARFKNNAAVLKMMKQASATLRIYENELAVGQDMPVVVLPDKDGKNHSTTTFKGQYYLVDIWATWCQRCSAFKGAEENLSKSYPAEKVPIVSIAMDNNINLWKSVISKFDYSSVQLIDTKMYQGPTVNKLLFDSIPFNFLVNPQGKIIAKAIKPDSLAIVLKKLVKK